MGTLISLKDFREKKNSRYGDLNEMLKRAQKLKDKVPKSDDLILQDFGDLKGLFEARLNQLLLDDKFIGTNFFLCSSYIAVLLARVSTETPKSWYAVDYVIDGYGDDDPFVLQNGADVCFILCALYPDRCNRRSMKIGDYISIGSTLYYSFYSQTKHEIGYHMSNLFEPMTEITAECMKNL